MQVGLVLHQELVNHVRSSDYFLDASVADPEKPPRLLMASISS